MTETDRLVAQEGDPRLGELLSKKGTSVIHRSENICIVECASEQQCPPWRGTNSNWTKVFERTFMPCGQFGASNAELVAEFFDWLGGKYVGEIEHARNRASYEHLFAVAQAHRSHVPCASLLDLGCGPAMILDSSIPIWVGEIVGYDIAPSVRDSARAHGLNVLDREAFCSCHKRFDMVLSSYVMHYGCDLAATVNAVALALKADGVWVMNFHKGLNLQELRAVLSASKLREVAPAVNSPFGPVLMVISDG